MLVASDLLKNWLKNTLLKLLLEHIHVNCTTHNSNTFKYFLYPLLVLSMCSSPLSLLVLSHFVRYFFNQDISTKGYRQKCEVLKKKKIPNSNKTKAFKSLHVYRSTTETPNKQTIQSYLNLFKTKIPQKSL